MSPSSGLELEPPSTGAQAKSTPACASWQTAFQTQEKTLGQCGKHTGTLERPHGRTLPCSLVTRINKLLPEVSLAGWLHVSLIRIVYTFVFLLSFNARLSQHHNSRRFFTSSPSRTCWKLLLMPLPPMFRHIDK